MINPNKHNCNKNTDAINKGDRVMNMHRSVGWNLRNSLMKRERTRVMSFLLVVGVLFLCVPTHAVVGPVARGIVRELLETLGKRGGKEIVEGISKKVGKEAMEELMEGAVKEVGEEGAKKLAKELGEQALKYGDDVFLVAKRYKVTQAVELLRELPEETGKKSIEALLNRGDEIIPLAKKFGKEVLEMEVKHPGLTKSIAEEFGEQGIKSLKNCDTNHLIILLKRKDILSNLTREGKEELCKKASNPSTFEKIIEIFKDPNGSRAITGLGFMLGGVYVIPKTVVSETTKEFPDGRVVKERLGPLHRKNIRYNPDGSMEESTIDLISSSLKTLMDMGKNIGVHYIFLFIGIGIGFLFIIRGLTPLVLSFYNKNNVSKKE